MNSKGKIVVKVHHKIDAKSMMLAHLGSDSDQESCKTMIAFFTRK